MAKDDYLPAKANERMVWLKHLAGRLPDYQALLDISAGDINSVQADSDAYEYGVISNLMVHQHSQAVYAYLFALSNQTSGTLPLEFPATTALGTPPAAVKPGIFPRVRRLIKRLKSHPNYTPNMGESLGVEGPMRPHVPLHPPRVKAISEGGGIVRLNWFKGTASGVRIQSMRGDETGWTVIGHDTHSPFMDTRPLLVPGQPEQRSYRLIYLRGDDPVGEPSDAVVAVAVE